ncbi:MAG TPA: hypothetical protein VGH65_05745 [Verrucomicrobiaceae bacterium]
MKFRHLLPAAAGMLLLANCSSPATRISKNPDLYHGLSEPHKALVQQGRITEGMNKEAVWLAWGRADRVATGSRGGRPYERWSYTGYEPYYSPTIGYAGGYWNQPYLGNGHLQDPRYFPDPMMNYLPYEARRAEFTSDRVSAWAAGR